MVKLGDEMLRIFKTISFLLVLSIVLSLSSQYPIFSLNVSIPHDEVQDISIAWENDVDVVVTEFHREIVISSNEDFDDQEWPGEGTPSEPYLISGLKIRSSKFCIMIARVDAYFVIEDCKLYPDDGSAIGIALKQVKRGEIRNCSIGGGACGIILEKSEELNITDSIFNKTETAISTEKCSFLSVQNNTIRNSAYGTKFTETDSFLLANNTVESCKFGLHFSRCDESEIFTNRVSQCGYGIYYSDGKKSELTNNKVSINIITGIFVEYSQDLLIGNNTIFENSGFGIYLSETTGCSIYGNELGWNTNGNAADYNGLSIDSVRHGNNWNSSHEGNGWSNHVPGEVHKIMGDRMSIDYRPTSVLRLEPIEDFSFEFGNPITLNWSAAALRPDYFVVSRNASVVSSGEWLGNNIIYQFDMPDVGVYKFNIDLNTTSEIHARDSVVVTVVDATSPDWVELPQNQTVELGYDFEYQLVATDLSGIEVWWINDTSLFNINETGVVFASGALQIGSYPLEIRVYDSHDNFISAEIVVSVLDTIFPVVNSPDDINVTEGYEGLSIVWSPTDLNPSKFIVYLDGELLISGNWNSSVEDIIVDIDGLEPKIYNYTILFFDLGNNSVSDSVMVQINEYLTTTTTTSETTTETETITETETTTQST